MRNVIGLCKQVPLLPVTLLSALPIALLWSVPLFVASADDAANSSFRPTLGQWIVILLGAVTVINALVDMVRDIRHGHVGVDLLAVIAILATIAVQEYWAGWAVMLMIWSGDAIEAYAQAKARGDLTMLVSAAPSIAHVADVPGSKADSRPHAVQKAVRGASAAERASTPAAASDGVNAQFHTVDVDSVRIGDLVVVLPGETVPVDGALLSNVATLDLSAINGEPLPRRIYTGARVMSGAVNGPSTLTMRVTQLAADSQYQRIISLVASAQSSRAGVVKTADVLAVPFTVISLIIAVTAWVLTGVPTRFAQVLVLATPCPLLIAAPVAYMAGTGRLAKAGMIVKTQQILEQLARTTHVFFDKTGTLTVKRPQVVHVDLVPSGLSVFEHVPDFAARGAADQSGQDRSQPDQSRQSRSEPNRPRLEHPQSDRSERFRKDVVLALAGLVETYSVHILAQGIAAAGKEALERLGVTTPPVIRNVGEDPGNGIAGEVDGNPVRVGRYSYVAEQLPSLKGRDETRMFSPPAFRALEPQEMATYVSIGDQLVARFVLEDIPRDNAASTITQLHSLGIDRISMVTGDSSAAAQTIARKVGITDVMADLLPEDKVNAVHDTHANAHATTMMVGDGVNDAPVLAAADIGIAITDGTSTAASESAEIVIMNDDVSAVPAAIRIARRTKQVMLQAVVAGLSLAVMGMIAAAFDLIPAVVGAFVQECIDVVSILWSLTAMAGGHRERVAGTRAEPNGIRQSRLERVPSGAAQAIEAE